MTDAPVLTSPLQRLTLRPVLTLLFLSAMSACRLETKANGTGDSTSIDSARRDSSATASSDSAWTMRIDGMGPVRVGMTAAEASVALRETSDRTLTADTTNDCHVVLLPGAPGVVRLMLVDGRVAAIYTTDSTITSDGGARVGASEATIQSLYAGRVSVEPHKYVDSGHNLVVSSLAPRDSMYRIIFETDGARVTEMRAGVLPVVAFSEHCS